MLPDPLMNASNCLSAWTVIVPDPAIFRLADWLFSSPPSNRPEPLRDTLISFAWPAAAILHEQLKLKLHTSTSGTKVSFPEPLNDAYISSPDAVPTNVIAPEPDSANASSFLAVT